jgi:transposase
MKVKGLRLMFAFVGHRLHEVRFSPEKVQVVLRPDRRKALWCPECGERVRARRSQSQYALDLALGGVGLVEIHYQARQACCTLCHGWTTFIPPGISAPHRATWRLMRTASRLAAHLPLSRAAQFLGLHDTRLRRWDKAVMQQEIPDPVLDNLEFLLIDEKSIGKGHDYITVVMNAVTGEIVHLAEGKRKDSLRAFFDTLTRWQKKFIKAVAMDRSGSYYACVREELPHVDVVFDKFHLVKNFNEVVDEVRRQEVKKSADEHKPFIKGQRYNLLRRPENLSQAQSESLEQLLAANEDLNIVYLLLDDFRDLLNVKSAPSLQAALARWCGWALACGLKPVVRFARNLMKRSASVVNIARWRLTNGLLEGFNNQIARIIRRGCGYRDNRYLFLKLRQAAQMPKLSLCEE